MAMAPLLLACLIEQPMVAIGSPAWVGSLSRLG
jgi:hypothetical protein